MFIVYSNMVNKNAIKITSICFVLLIKHKVALVLKVLLEAGSKKDQITFSFKKIGCKIRQLNFRLWCLLRDSIVSAKILNQNFLKVSGFKKIF